MRELLHPTTHARVYPIGEQRFRLITLLAGTLEGHIWIYPKADAAFLACVAIFEPPPAGTAPVD